MTPDFHIVITCEHASNKIPKPYAAFFKNAKSTLATHRGYDIGALSVARFLAKYYGSKFFEGQYSRLLIDLNRSLHHSRIFSEFVNTLNQTEKQQIIDQYYLPYRSAVESHMGKIVKDGGLVLHLSIHSFTLEMNGRIRDADFGLLYDPKRQNEKQIVQKMKKHLQRNLPQFNTRCNFPYKGTADGFTTYLRKKFEPNSYVGIEFEINQHLFDRQKNLTLSELKLLGKSIDGIFV